MRATNQRFHMFSDAVDVRSLQILTHSVISRDDNQRDVASQIRNPIEYLRFVMNATWTSTNSKDYIEFIQSLDHRVVSDWWDWKIKSVLKLIEDGVLVNLIEYRTDFGLLCMLRSYIFVSLYKDREILERILVALAHLDEIDTVFRNAHVPWTGAPEELNTEVELMRDYQMWTLHQRQ